VNLSQACGDSRASDCSRDTRASGVGGDKVVAQRKNTQNLEDRYLMLNDSVHSLYWIKRVSVFLVYSIINMTSIISFVTEVVHQSMHPAVPR
jgi:hypothetical protein